MTIHKDELDKLAPEERIKKLKHMEEMRKKEVKQIEEMIKDSMQELSVRKIADEITPPARQVDISRLFEAEHEDTPARKAKEPIDEIRYEKVIQLYDDYSKLKQLYHTISGGASLNPDQRAAVGQIGERILTAEKYIADGEKLASILDASRVVLYKLRKEVGLN